MFAIPLIFNPRSKATNIGGSSFFGSVSLVYRKFLFNYSAFPIEPKISIFSFTVALIASAPGANNLRGSNPFPSKSLPASIYLRVASAKEI